MTKLKTIQKTEKFTCPMCDKQHKNHYRHKEHVKRCFE